MLFKPFYYGFCSPRTVFMRLRTPETEISQNGSPCIRSSSPRIREESENLRVTAACAGADTQFVWLRLSLSRRRRDTDDERLPPQPAGREMPAPTSTSTASSTLRYPPDHATSPQSSSRHPRRRKPANTPTGRFVDLYRSRPLQTILVTG